MASSWNKGVKVVDIVSTKVDQVAERVGQEVAAAAPMWQSVVDRASEALATGAEFVSDTGADLVSRTGEAISGAVDNVSDFVSNIPLPDTPEFDPFQGEVPEGFEPREVVSPEAMVKALKFASPVLSQVLPLNARKFAEFMSNDGNINMSVDDLHPIDQAYLKQKAIDTIRGGGDSFSYETWGFKDKSILMSDLKKTAVKSMVLPSYRMATLIGRTGKGNVRVEDGRVIVEDVYDFNTGPLGTKLQKALVLKETGDIEGYEKLAEEVFGDRPYFEKMRIWAAALGVPQGEGTRYKLDLGPAPKDLM